MELDTTITLLLNGSQNVYIDTFVMLATKAWIWMGLYAAMLYVIFREHDMRNFLAILAGLLLCVLIADQVSSGIVKPLVARFRPSHSPEIAHLVDVVNGYRGGRYGFFSSHASNTMAIAVFLSKVLRNKSVTLTLLTWSLLNCWTRLYLGVHYLSDILTGLVFGAFVGFTLYTIYRRFIAVSTHRCSPTILNIIPCTFLITLIVIAIPWKLCF